MKKINQIIVVLFLTIICFAVKAQQNEKTQVFLSKSLVISKTYNYVQILPSKTVDKITVVSKDSTLSISEKSGVVYVSGTSKTQNNTTIVQNQGGSTVIIGNNNYSGGNITIVNNDVWIDGKKVENSTSTSVVPQTLTIYVPEHTNLSISNNGRDVSIGFVEVSLSYLSTGSDDLLVNKLKDGTIQATGSGDITIRNVMGGNLSIQKTGSGDLKITSGYITNLDIQSTGSGDTVIEASVENSKITRTGSGSIDIKKLINDPQFSSFGSGSLTINGKSY